MKNVVIVLTYGRYAFHEEGYDAEVTTPHKEDLLDNAQQEKIKADFKENVDTLISAFESDVRDLKAEFQGEEIHYGMDSGYVIKTDNSDYLAIDVYWVNTAAPLPLPTNSIQSINWLCSR